MASTGSASRGSQNMIDDLNGLSAGAVWKGENESDAELVESYSSPLGDAGAWTEEEAYRVYREKLVRLRDLYVGQLDHMHHTFQEKRRQFLLQWQYASRRRKRGEEIPRVRGREDIAYGRYRRKSGEEALLEHKLKQRRSSASLEYFLKKDQKEIYKPHSQYLARLHHHLSQAPHHCSNQGCESKCLPFSTKCSRHICDDDKQLLYTKCCYMYTSGIQCTNPIPKYIDPLLCGGHCDNIRPPKSEEGGTRVELETTLGQTEEALAQVLGTEGYHFPPEIP